MSRAKWKMSGKLWEEMGYKLIKWGAFVCIAFILCIFILSDSISYGGMNHFNHSQAYYILIAVSILSIGFFIGNRMNGKVNINRRKMVLFLTLLLFVIQTVINLSTHILASWDISSAIIPAAKAVADKEDIQQWFCTYYSRYENNLLICWIYSKLFMLLKLLHCYDPNDSLSVIVFVNSAFACLSIYLVYHCTTKLVGETWGMVAWVCSMVCIGANPWFLVTYTDAFAIWISVSIFCMVLHEENRLRDTFYKYFLIGVFAFLGYHIKPQSSIVFIAFCIVKFIGLFVRYIKRNRGAGIIAFSAVLSGLILSSGMYSIIEADLPFVLEEEAAFSMTHYMMMGLNSETDGKYLGSDVEYSASFATKKERNAGNAKVVIERLKTYGVKGYIQHIIRKTAICYTDGTFGYSDGAMHPQQQYDSGNRMIAELAGYFLYPYNDGFVILENILQVFWVAILLGMVGFCFQKNLSDSVQELLMLVLIGTFLFEMVFEVQPRHLYCNVPLYVITGMIGLKQIKQWVCRFGCE